MTMSNGRNGAIPHSAYRNKWDNVWQWGNPFLQKSDSRFLGGATYGVLRFIIAVEFMRTYAIWKRDNIELDTDESELLRVMALEKEAIRDGCDTVQAYIATQLDTSQQRVSRLLHLASIHFIEDELTNYGYEPESTYSISETQVSKWYPSKKQIEKKMASIPRICAVGYDGCQGVTNSGKLAICYPCHHRIKREQELSSNPKLMPEWTTVEENRIRRAHYKEAVEACFKDHYGTISIDEAESYLDAA